MMPRFIWNFIVRAGTDFYVYLLLDPRKNDAPFYVGKGRGNRCSDHLLENRRDPNRHKKFTIAAILRSGNLVGIEKRAIDLSEPDAFRMEIELIEKIGRRDIGTGPLTNLTNGGEGQRGAKFTEAHRAKMRFNRAGQKNAMFGRRHTETAIAAIRDATKARTPTPHSESHKKSLRDHNPGGIAVSRPINQVDVDGSIVRQWQSGAAAANALGLSKGNIHRCASDRKHWKAGGYSWRFSDGMTA